MKSIFAAACLSALALAAPAGAATFWANGVTWTPGEGTPANNPVPNQSPARYNPDNALGDPSDPGPFDFLALGLSDFNGHEYSYGYADFTFGRTFEGETTGEVFEITWGNRSGYPEYAKIFVGLNNVFTEVADIVNDVSTGLSFAYNGTFDTVRILDTTRFELAPANPVSFDGFDVDAVGITTAAVPLPPAALALGAALAALGGLGRRRKAA